jgi:hypothetical protein
MTRGEHIWEVWGYMKAFDIPTPEELIQKP